MFKILTVAFGGAAGAVARYWLGELISSKYPLRFPIGTFVINVSGSFVIGLFLTLASERMAISPNLRLLVSIGFVGAFTTFSTFEFETFKLIEAGSFLSAAGNVILSLAAGFAAVWLGVVTARSL